MIGDIVTGASGATLGIAAGVGAVALLRKRFSKKKIEGRTPHTTFVLSGNLKQTSLLDAIQFLEIGKRQGIMHVYSGRRKGYLTFIAGRVVDAFYRNQTGREAVFSMLDLEEGDFYFEPRIVAQPKLIQESILDLAFEWDARKK
jgi:hypothetical protein